MVFKYWPWLSSLVAVAFGVPSFSRDVSGSLKHVNNWPESGLPIGQVGGVAVDPEDNNVYIFHRDDREWNAETFDRQNKLSTEEVSKGPIAGGTILRLDSLGNVVEHMGENMFYMPHGLTIDNEGNMYVTDVGLHQVMRLNRNKGAMKVDLTLGTKLIPGGDANHFCKPTDVAVMKNGDFFVADGYCNSRILKYSQAGKLLETIEKKAGAYDSNYDFLIPHSLTMVHDDVCVADRENSSGSISPKDSAVPISHDLRDYTKNELHSGDNHTMSYKRIQCFNAKTGDFVTSYSSRAFGPVYAIAYDSNDNVIHLVTQRDTQRSVGFTINRRGRILAEWQPRRGFGIAHDVAVSPSGKEVYVGEIWPKRVTKFTK